MLFRSFIGIQTDPKTSPEKAKKKKRDLVLLIFGYALDLDLFCITEQRAKMTSEMHEGTILV